MNDLKIGQILWLKFRFNNNGEVSDTKHPYLVINVDHLLGYVEVAQMDSLAGKEYKAIRECNKIIYNDDPVETVITKDSYIQLDNTFMIENFEDIAIFRKTKDRLSDIKLEDAILAYKQYHAAHDIEESKIVFVTKDELLSLNN